MKLSRKSRLVKWAYLMPPFEGPPYRTSLCAFFWRAFVFVPLFWLSLVIIAGRLLFLYGKYWRYSISVTVVVALVVFAIITACNAAERRRDARAEENWQRRRAGLEPLPVRRYRLADSVFWQGLKAVKGKVCPLIELT